LGTSNWQNISYNIGLLRKIDPYTILDIGIGFGRWGILMREFLEIWETGKYDGKWNRKIDGIEIFPGYLKDYHNYFYDNIYNEDALGFMKKPDTKYDLINCGDVIEHFEKKDGEELINLCIDKSRYVLITIPIGKNWEQQGTNDNPHESHKSVWYNNDFTKYKYHKIKSFTDFMMRDFSVVLLSGSKFKFTKKHGKYFSIKNFLKYKLGLRRLLEKFGK